VHGREAKLARLAVSSVSTNSDERQYAQLSDVGLQTSGCSDKIHSR
jgi:hypothetical protein